jgi:Uma2 family endonuclease
MEVDYGHEDRVMGTRVILIDKDYEARPSDGRRYELHEGALSVTPALSPRHQRISLKLSMLLEHHAASHGLGQVFSAPVDCILSDSTVVQPDVVFVDTARLERVSSGGIEGAPALVVEILSPSSIEIDRHIKFQLYARYRALRYWIVDPDARTIESYSLSGEGYDLAGRVAGAEAVSLPHFRALAVDPASIWL